MQTLEITQKEGFAIVKLHRGAGNPINLQMMSELSDFFKNAENNPEIGAVILTGNPGIFTAGLDVVELYSLDKAGSYNFWKRFVDLATELVAFSKPLIAAIPGHSPAGGCVFACCADYRVMAEGENYRIGLPADGNYKLLFNSDEDRFGGSNHEVKTSIKAEKIEQHGRNFSASFLLPPLSVLIYKHEKKRAALPSKAVKTSAGTAKKSEAKPGKTK
jgi:hypothetical protein